MLFKNALKIKENNCVLVVSQISVHVNESDAGNQMESDVGVWTQIRRNPTQNWSSDDCDTCDGRTTPTRSRWSDVCSASDALKTWIFQLKTTDGDALRPGDVKTQDSRQKNDGAVSWTRTHWSDPLPI